MKVWLEKVAGVEVEHVPVRYASGERIASSLPRKGVTHTTEGSLESAHTEFVAKFAPTFLIGYSAAGKLRIIQYLPIGVMAYALDHPSGTPETNRMVMAQVEQAAFSQHGADIVLDVGGKRVTPTKEYKRTLAALLGQIRDAADVPLKRGGDGTRSLHRWQTYPGWFSHAEVPNNVHWDCGGQDIEAVFKMAPKPPDERKWRFVLRNKWGGKVAQSSAVSTKKRKAKAVKFVARVAPKMAAMAARGHSPRIIRVLVSD